VLALVVMATLTTILALVTAQLFTERQQSTRRQHQLQADWLARAGVELAAARLLEKPAAFTEEIRDLVHDGHVRIVVEKTDADGYAVTVEAEVGREQGVPVARTVTARFRRTAQGDTARLQAVPPAPSKEP
jgi:hypothetical protein